MVEDEKYSPEEIWEMDAETWTMGNDELRRLIAMALSKVPSSIVDKVYEDCLFHSLSEEAEGDILSPEIIKSVYLIGIHSKILEGNSEKAIRVVLHEVAHYYLNHRHFLVDFEPTPEEYNKQEEEANLLVEKWLPNNPN